MAPQVELPRGVEADGVIVEAGVDLIDAGAGRARPARPAQRGQRDELEQAVLAERLAIVGCVCRPTSAARPRRSRHAGRGSRQGAGSPSSRRGSRLRRVPRASTAPDRGTYAPPHVGRCAGGAVEHLHGGGHRLAGVEEIAALRRHRHGWREVRPDAAREQRRSAARQRDLPSSDHLSDRHHRRPTPSFSRSENRTVRRKKQRRMRT